MKLFLKKLAQNNMVMVLTGLPNLGINIGTQFILDVVFHWSGFYSLLAYLIGVFCSVQYSVLWAMFTRSNFKAFGKQWDFSHKKEPGNA